MRFKWILSFFLIVSHLHSFGQLPSKAMKLIGTWKYEGGSGYEVWTENSGTMHGVAYRINKIGDTSIVEVINLSKVNKQLVYSLQTKKIVGDSVVAVKNVFIGGKRKLEFFNVEAGMPYSISYKTGFLNKNKLKIKIQRGSSDEPVVLILYRIKD